MSAFARAPRASVRKLVPQTKTAAPPAVKAAAPAETHRPDPRGDLALAEDEPGEVCLRGRGPQALPQRPALAVREVVQDLLAAGFL